MGTLVTHHCCPPCPSVGRAVPPVCVGSEEQEGEDEDSGVDFGVRIDVGIGGAGCEGSGGGDGDGGGVGRVSGGRVDGGRVDGGESRWVDVRSDCGALYLICPARVEGVLLDLVGVMKLLGGWV